MKLIALAMVLPLTPLWALDLTTASISAPSLTPGPEQKAVTVLQEEVQTRTQILLGTHPSAAGPAILIERGQGPAEGYRLAVTGNRVTVSGNDERGVLFGVGRLLREMHMSRGKLWIEDGLSITTAPRYPLRGHQLGYRPKTNSYDAWTVPMWDQYIRDLAIFGTNAIELIPPRSDDDSDSPHFSLPQMQMMVEMSRICKEYGLQVWIWYPAMDRDYSDPATVDFALKEWGEVFKKLPRIDGVLVPGGDPGHTQPKYMFALLEKETEVLHRYHPKAQMWMSPQSFDQKWMDEFYSIIKTEPKWLSGVVFGPQVPVPLAELRARVPMRYPIRNYPDITHSRQCQYPVPDWDTTYAFTEAREVINPRPVDMANIFRRLTPYTIGFISYSEGCNDDVNKIVWSSLGWDPDRKVVDILRDYARYFISDRYAEGFAQGLLRLEGDWRGPLLTNAGVETTFEQFREMERDATPQEREEWRFQQALYRAYYDAYDRRRLIYETELEQQAMDRLRETPKLGSLLAMDEARRILDRSVTHRVGEDLRARVFELAEALFQSIHMQLSVPRYQAIAVDRGANLDTIDHPLNNRGWLEAQFAELRKTDEVSRQQGIEGILNWTNPGPGGFYDDLGNLAEQPHLVRGLGYHKDPAFLQSSLIGFSYRPTWRQSWWNDAGSLNDSPLEMHYSGLDPKAQYKIRVVYAGDSMQRKIRMLAGGIEVHPYMIKPQPVHPIEFDIPAGAVRDGELTVTWYREKGLGANGRGCQVAEVWLIRK